MELVPVETADVERYLATGNHDCTFMMWSGPNLIDRCRRGDAAVCAALIVEVRRRSQGRSAPDVPDDLDVISFTRARVAPTARGLFPRYEHGAVLDVLACAEPR